MVQPQPAAQQPGVRAQDVDRRDPGRRVDRRYQGRMPSTRSCLQRRREHRHHPVTVAVNGASVGSFAFTGGTNASGSGEFLPSERLRTRPLKR
jgi:hypothetical protein